HDRHATAAAPPIRIRADRARPGSGAGRPHRRRLRRPDPLIMQGDPDVRRTPASMGWAFEPIALPVKGNTTTGWWLPVDQPRCTVLFSHGNDGNIGTRTGEAARFRELDCNVLLF